MKLTEELYLMNKNRNRLKRFRKYENIEHKANNYIEIDFGCIYRVSTKPVWKGTRIESIEDGLKEYDELLKEGWRRTSLYRRNL